MRLHPLAAAGLFLCLFSGNGPGEAAGRRKPAVAPHVDFRVVVWYRKSDPLGTFQYQVYDVRKGEDSPAVDRWINDLEHHYTSYIVIERKVDLSRERGETEHLKVGAVVQRELLGAAAMAGVVIGGPTGVAAAPSTPRRSTTSIPRPGQPLGAASASNLGPTPPSFPVPFPYPRPHP